MTSAYDNVMRIVDASTLPDARLTAIRGFAEELDWIPSYEFRGTFGVDEVEDHLVVEHGLENSAIISFLRAPARAADLDATQIRNLLTISYNNLVEWHIFVSEAEIRYVNNLSPNTLQVHPLTRTTCDQFLSGQHFDEVVSHPVRRSLPSCNDVFIQMISRWKRRIKADYKDQVENRHLSALFNAIILVRGCEDQRALEPAASTRLLLNALDSREESQIGLVGILADALRLTGIDDDLSLFVDKKNLEPFSHFDKGTAIDLFRDFYRPTTAGYEFNFALMSKHALSRIYERYVALLEFDEEQERQLSFIKPSPNERISAKAGTVYTPQFIAGFFARYLRENTTPRTFRSVRSIDPACGSGIFLRSLLEIQCNPLVPGTTPQSIKEAFDATLGIDRDPNACEAARLSLTLLHLVALGRLLPAPKIENGDAIQMALQGKLTPNSFGAVLANPPFIKRDHLSDAEVSTYQNYLELNDVGRIDSYLAFAKLCLELVEPAGFVCLVLPQVFLMARNAAFLRRFVATSFDVRCLVDLTAVPVFEGVGTYNILLIAQKRAASMMVAPDAQVAIVQEFVGPALQACLDGREFKTPYYSVFNVAQTFFQSDQWILLGPVELELNQKLAAFKPASHYLDVRQGFLSGADDIFIRNRAFVPAGEEAIYADYLPDRKILRYGIPSRAEDVVFYPFERGKPLAEARLRSQYPRHLEVSKSARKKLRSRRSVSSGDTPWWRPVRPRDPQNMLVPKIVCPHLMLTPRFAIDLKGSYAVSHAPYFIAKENDEEITLLKFFCAVLNSSVCHWYLTTHAPKYSRGYNRLEVALVKNIPMPDPARVPPGTLRELIGLIDRSLKRGSSSDIDMQIDRIVCNLYGLTPSEQDLLLGQSDDSNIAQRRRAP